MRSPVHLKIEAPHARARVHLLIRLLLLMALGTIGCSSLYWALYLGLPAAAALLVSQRGGARVLSDHGPALTRALKVIAAVYAYVWLLRDEISTDGLQFEVRTTGTPTAGSALLRLLTSIPALILLALMSFVATFVWIVGALFVLVGREVPAAAADFMQLTLRYQFRLVAYHMSLVEEYPSLEAEPADLASASA